MSSRATFATLALATLLAFPCPGHAGPVNVLQPRDMSLTEGEKTDQVVWGTDEDGLALDFSLESAPKFVTMIGFGISEGAVFDTLSFPPRGTSADILLAPGYSDAGSWMVSLRATDGVNSDTKTFLISVEQCSHMAGARVPGEPRRDDPARGCGEAGVRGARRAVWRPVQSGGLEARFLHAALPERARGH